MSSDEEDQIPMADEEEHETSNGGGVTSAPYCQETANLTSLPVLEAVTPKNEETPAAPGMGSNANAGTLFDNDLSPEEQEEKARLIAQVLELQNTLDDLSSRVDNVKEENLRLRSENQVLGQYIGRFLPPLVKVLVYICIIFFCRKSHGCLECFPTCQ